MTSLKINNWPALLLRIINGIKWPVTHKFKAYHQNLTVIHLVQSLPSKTVSIVNVIYHFLNHDPDTGSSNKHKCTPTNLMRMDQAQNAQRKWSQATTIIRFGGGAMIFFFFFLCKYHIFYQVKNLFFVNNLILQFTDRNVDKILQKNYRFFMSIDFSFR